MTVQFALLLLTQLPLACALLGTPPDTVPRSVTAGQNVEFHSVIQDVGLTAISGVNAMSKAMDEAVTYANQTADQLLDELVVASQQFEEAVQPVRKLEEASLDKTQFAGRTTQIVENMISKIDDVRTQFRATMEGVSSELELLRFDVLEKRVSEHAAMASAGQPLPAVNALRPRVFLKVRSRLTRSRIVKKMTVLAEQLKGQVFSLVRNGLEHLQFMCDTTAFRSDELDAGTSEKISNSCPSTDDVVGKLQSDVNAATDRVMSQVEGFEHQQAGWQAQLDKVTSDAEGTASSADVIQKDDSEW